MFCVISARVSKIDRLKFLITIIILIIIKKKIENRQIIKDNRVREDDANMKSIYTQKICASKTVCIRSS